MLRAIVSIQRVETCFGVSKTIVYVLRNKYHATGLVKDRPRLVRQRVTKRAQDRYMRIAHLRNLVESAVNTADEYAGGKPISRVTVSRHFRHDATIKATVCFSCLRKIYLLRALPGLFVAIDIPSI